MNGQDKPSYCLVHSDLKDCDATSDQSIIEVLYIFTPVVCRGTTRCQWFPASH